MKLPIAFAAFLLSALSGFSASRAASPVAPEPKWTPITLDRDPGANAIGVEPFGGVFAKVLEPHSKAVGHFEFSTFSKKQAVSILTIYATNQSFIQSERPLARVRLKTLKPGAMRHRISILMQLSDGKLLISATDQEFHLPMEAIKITEKEVQMATLEEPIAGIAGGPGTNQNAPDTTIKQYIGVRDFGGIFEPVLAMLPNGKLITTEKAHGVTYIRTAFPGARTADVRLYAGKGAFVDYAKPYGRYIVSGMTNPEQKNAFRLELQPEPNGKIKLIANEREPGTKSGKIEYKQSTLRVDKYSRSALEHLEASGQLGQSLPELEARTAGHIPADPLH